MIRLLTDGILIAGRKETNVATLTKALEIINARKDLLKENLDLICWESDVLVTRYFNHLKDIKTLEKAIRKANFYRKITVDVECSYDHDTRIITFPKDMSKKLIYKWLINNNIPIKDEYYRISSPYDCTGEITSIYVRIKNNTVTVTRNFDV